MKYMNNSFYRLVFGLLFLTYSISGLASETDDLLQAIRQDNFEVAKPLLDHGLDISKIYLPVERVDELPSSKMASLLFEYGLDFNAFLDTVLRWRYTRKQQYTDDFHDLASLYYSLLSGAGKYNFDSEEKNEYLKSILEKRKEIAKISNPELDEAVYVKRRNFDLGQVFLRARFVSLLSNADSYLEEGHMECSLKNGKIFCKDPIKDLIKDSIEIARAWENSPGSCMGLTTVWLYSKWWHKSYGYNSAWFKKIMNNLSIQNYDIVLSKGDLADLQQFGYLVDFFQNPKRYLGGLSVEMDKLIYLSELDTDGKTLQKKYSIIPILTKEQFCGFVREMVHDDDWVYIEYPFHAAGLFKQGASYYFYDPNDLKGEYQSTSIESIADVVFYLREKLYDSGAIQITIFRDSESPPVSYSKEKEIFDFIKTIADKKRLLEIAVRAICLGLLEPLQLCLEQGLDPNLRYSQFSSGQAQMPLLFAATTLGDRGHEIAAELLKRGADPNAYCDDAQSEPKIINWPLKGKTALHVAAQYGLTKLLKTLLNDPRTDVNKKNIYDGKTALMYATENGHMEIADLLRADVRYRTSNFCWWPF